MRRFLTAVRGKLTAPNNPYWDVLLLPTAGIVMKSLLARADHELQRKGAMLPVRWRPHYHLAPQAGWMNDPNGLCWFDGYYHAFYQHYPYAPEWGPMHWGHARSRDLVRWEYCPVALAPAGDADKDGCFSGSAVVNGQQLALIYTGHRWMGTPGDDNHLHQVQCLATSEDGIHFTRHECVLEAPAGIHHFRDPKVWRENEQWYMVVGAKVADRGEVQLWQSADLHHWVSAGVLAQAGDHMGFMWECPDFFALDDRHVLMFSPQGMQATGYKNRNLYQSGYLCGSWQPGEAFVPSRPFQEMDYGHDFYAPQSFLAPDGRRIVIGWLDMWESPMPEKEDGWAGMLSLPREITLDPEGRLRMTPVAEVITLRQDRQLFPVQELVNQQREVCPHCNAMEVVLIWDTHSDAEAYGISLGQGVRLYVDNQARRIVLERRYPQYALWGDRSVPLPAGDTVSMRLFFDSSSLEVFINHGDACLSSRIYPEEDQRQLTLFAWSGKAVLQEGLSWTLAG